MERALKETVQRQVAGLELLSAVHPDTKLYWQVKDQCWKREHQIYQKFSDRPFLFRILKSKLWQYFLIYIEGRTSWGKLGHKLRRKKQ